MARQHEAPGSAIQRYTGTAIALHWVIAVMIFAAFAMGWYMVDLPQGDLRAWFFRNHKNIGLTVGLLLLLRIYWRLKHAAPPLPASMPSWERQIAHYSHTALYVLMVLLPITGFLTTSFTGYPTKFWGIPFDIGSWGGKNKPLNDFFSAIHITIAYSLMALVVLHAAAALRHYFIVRDGVFERMLPRARRRQARTKTATDPVEEL